MSSSCRSSRTRANEQACPPASLAFHLDLAAVDELVPIEQPAVDGLADLDLARQTCDSIRLAAFTVSPQRPYVNLWRPMTPATTGPLSIPIRIDRSIASCHRVSGSGGVA